jgi:hypothetical protein
VQDKIRKAETGLKDFEGKPFSCCLRRFRGELQAIDNSCPTFLSIWHAWSSRMFNNIITFALYEQFIIDIKAKSHRRL